jgi:3-hydroxy acid dehydrogenase/malonic semialdehyde reductase
MIVLITGATGGLGKAFAHKFAREGHKLILTSRKPSELSTLQKELRADIMPLIFDVSDTITVQGALKKLPPAWQNIDVLINNAGNAHGLAAAQEADLNDWHLMIDGNCKGLVTLTHAVLPGMVARGAGHIINIGSAAGEYPYPSGNVYCATKAFVDQFSRALRCDLISTGVRVTNIAPGMVETTFSLNRFKGDAERAAKTYAGANALQAEDIAETVYWATMQPKHVNINHIEIMPTTQAAGPLQVFRG